MDDRKDIQRTDNLSKFLDSPVIQTSPFGRNASGERAYRRAERVVAAIHILTNHIPAQEHSRIRARGVSLELLSNLLALRDEMRVSTSLIFRAVQASVRELISLVRVLSVSGYLSIQNATSVIEALDELGNFLISSQRSTLSETVAFTKEDLIGSDAPITRTTFSRKPSSVGTPHSPGGIKSDAILKDISRTGGKISDIGHILDRRTQIVLETLKSQGTIGIKDISSNLPEYSEKMVQRELVHLVALGRVKKIGFKRWSKYAFVR